MPFHERKGDDLILAFPTPVLAQVVPDVGQFNRELRAIVEARAGSDPGTGGSNVGGWHSAPDFFTWDHPQVRRLGQWVRDAIGRMTRHTGGGEFRDEELDRKAHV